MQINVHLSWDHGDVKYGITASFCGVYSQSKGKTLAQNRSQILDKGGTIRQVCSMWIIVYIFHIL